MDRSNKRAKVAELTRTFSESTVVVVTRNLGLTASQSTDLRVKMREAGATFKVAKNRLAKIAIKETEYRGLADLLVGPTALAISTDPVAAAKVVAEFARSNEKIEIVGGAMGDQMLDADGVRALATLPSLDELRGQIIGLIQAPASRLARVLQAPATWIATVIAVSERSPAHSAAVEAPNVGHEMPLRGAEVREVCRQVLAGIATIDDRSSSRISYEMIAGFAGLELPDERLHAAITMLTCMENRALEPYYVYAEPDSKSEMELEPAHIAHLLRVGPEDRSSGVAGGYSTDHIRPYFRVAASPPNA